MNCQCLGNNNFLSIVTSVQNTQSRGQKCEECIGSFKVLTEKLMTICLNEKHFIVHRKSNKYFLCHVQCEFCHQVVCGNLINEGPETLFLKHYHFTFQEVSMSAKSN